MLPESSVAVSICIKVLAFAVPFVVFPIPFVPRPFGVQLNTFSVSSAVFPLPFVLLAVGPRSVTLSVWMSFFQISLVTIPIRALFHAPRLWALLGDWRLNGLFANHATFTFYFIFLPSVGRGRCCLPVKFGWSKKKRTRNQTVARWKNIRGRKGRR